MIEKKKNSFLCLTFHITPTRWFPCAAHVQPYHDDMVEGNRKYSRRSYWLLHSIEGTVVTDSPRYIIYYIIYRKPPFTLGCLFNWSCVLKTKSKLKKHVSLHRFASNLYKLTSDLDWHKMDYETYETDRVYDSMERNPGVNEVCVVWIKIFIVEFVILL